MASRSRNSSRSSGQADHGGAEREVALVSQVGPFQIDWPRSLGYFGGAAMAVAVGLVDPPVGVFIAAIPFLKMLDLPRLPLPSRFLGQVLEGVAKPVGGDSQGTIRVVTRDKGASDQPVQ